MEIEMTVEEIERQIRKLKKKKAPGRDGVQNEAWISDRRNSRETG
jgi:ribosome-associated translation inhibitor RaiA